MPLDPLSSLTSSRQRLDALLMPTDAPAAAGAESARPISPPASVEPVPGRRMDDPQRKVLLRLVRDALESGLPDTVLAPLDQLWSAERTREDCWYLRGRGRASIGCPGRWRRCSC